VAWRPRWHDARVNSNVRHGVFLRPDPLTCAAVTRITTQLRAQYGLVSAGAFPPHVTLAGSLPVADGEPALVQALDDALAPVAPFPVRSRGIGRLGPPSVVYDVHELDGEANPALVALAATVDAAVRPLLVAAPGLPADLYAPGRWRAHISLASHDLFAREDLREEVEEYVRGLDVDVPASFTADTVALYSFEHPSWTGAWWDDMRWEYRRSWRLHRSRPRAMT
jgi:2'-5' RNA ligase